MWALLQPARITNKVKRAMNRVLGWSPWQWAKHWSLSHQQRGLGNGRYLLQWCCSMGDPDNCFFLNLTTISQIFIKIAVLGYKHFMLENSRYTCIHIKISPCLGLLTMDQTWLVHLFFSLTLNTKKDIIENYQKQRKICRNQDHTTKHKLKNRCTSQVVLISLVHS
jgi:hypothetical protein